MTAEITVASRAKLAGEPHRVRSNVIWQPTIAESKSNREFSGTLKTNG